VNGRRPLTATPAPKREIRFAPLSWKAPLLPPLLEGGVADNVAPAPISACFGIWSGARSAELAQSSAWPRLSRAFYPREDKAIAMPVLSLSGMSSASGAGPAVSALGRKVSGLGFHCPGRFVRKAAMANMGDPRRKCGAASPRVFAVPWRSGRLLSIAAHGAVDADPQGSRERR
jgi:hypothetical protein